MKIKLIMIVKKIFSYFAQKFEKEIKVIFGVEGEKIKF